MFTYANAWALYLALPFLFVGSEDSRVPSLNRHWGSLSRRLMYCLPLQLQAGKRFLLQISSTILGAQNALQDSWVFGLPKATGLNHIEVLALQQLIYFIFYHFGLWSAIKRIILLLVLLSTFSSFKSRGVLSSITICVVQINSIRFLVNSHSGRLIIVRLSRRYSPTPVYQRPAQKLLLILGLLTVRSRTLNTIHLID